MAHTKAENVQDLEAIVRRAAAKLPAAGVARLVKNADAVEAALVSVAATLGAGRRSSKTTVETVGQSGAKRVDADEARKRLDARTTRADERNLLTSDEMAERLGLKTRQSVHDRLKSGRLIGWEGARRGYVLPAGQLDDRDKPLAGLDIVRGHFPDGYSAWVWLTTPLKALDGDRPLDRLRAGDAAHVASAATGDAQGDFA